MLLYLKIEQLKNSLRGFEEYNFTYLTNHNTLVQDLIKFRG